MDLSKWNMDIAGDGNPFGDLGGTLVWELGACFPEELLEELLEEFLPHIIFRI